MSLKKFYGRNGFWKKWEKEEDEETGILVISSKNKRLYRNFVSFLTAGTILQSFKQFRDENLTKKNFRDENLTY